MISANDAKGEIVQEKQTFIERLVLVKILVSLVTEKTVSKKEMTMNKTAKASELQRRAGLVQFLSN
jgi:hypothetical protein